MTAMLLLQNIEMFFGQEGTPFSENRNFIVWDTNMAALISKSALNRDHTRTYEQGNNKKTTLIKIQ